MTYAAEQTARAPIPILPIMRGHDPAVLERLLLYIYGEADELKRELALLANELTAEDRNRFEGTLTYVQTETAALLLAMPDHISN